MVINLNQLFSRHLFLIVSLSMRVTNVSKPEPLCSGQVTQVVRGGVAAVGTELPAKQ